MNGVTEKSALIYSCQGLVRSIAWKIHQKLPSTVDLDDLIGFGQIGLAEAARDFDQQRGVQFTTYAYYRVRGSILDGLSKMSWFSKIDYARGRYERTSNELLESSASSGTGDDAEWFAETTRTVSMSYVMTHWSGESGFEPADNGTPGDAAESNDLQGWVREAVDSLPEPEQTLLRAIYYDGLTIKEAGERVGISKAWASRLHARTLDSLALRLADCHD
ncbi:MAG: sigma-70 family RNA polymerase sigma factor [Planctomycetaceae bacterium]|nr:sigma-70 family RNA polymerase sigma factor [Planctomycetaceae bacterium]